MHADGALGAGLVRFVLAGRQAHCKCIWTTITLGGIFNGQFCQDLERYNGRAGTAARRMVGFVASVNAQAMAKQRGLEQECTLTGHSKPVYSAAYSPDGKHVASAWGDTTGATGDNGCLERWVRDSVGKSLSERRAHVCTTPRTASATARARRQQQICVSAPRAHLSLLFLLLLPSVATAQPCGPAHISVRTPADLRADLRPAKHHSSSSRLGHTS